MSVHQTVFVRGFVLGGFSVKTQGGVGSVASVVAAELSTVEVKLELEMTIAFATLSFSGGAEVTVNC